MNNKNDKNPEPQLSQVDIQKLLMQQLMQQKTAGGAPGVGGNAPIAKKVNPIIRFGTWALQKSEKSIYYLDRFTNFIVKKHDTDRDDVMQSARYPILFGAWVTFIFVGIGGVWSAFAPLDSAATALGTVIVSTHKQVVQHPAGGIIKRIFIQQGDYVIENQPLIELDETQLNANYQTSLTFYRTALAAEARIIAERDNTPEIKFSDFLLADAHKDEVEKILHTQNALFKSKQETFNGMVGSYMKKMEQTLKQLEAMESKKQASDRTLEIMQERYNANKKLSQQGFIQRAQLLDIERQLVGTQSEVAGVDSEIARIHQEVSKEEIELFSKKSEYLSNIMRELKDAQMQLTDAREKYNTAKDTLGRSIIRSPVEGVVNELNYHTIGGVISQSQPIAEITPYKGNLIIEAKIAQKDIDSLRVGLKAKMRFSAFKSRTTPVFTGTVVSLTPDVVQDKSGQQHPGGDTFYVARIEIDMEEFNKAAKERGLKLHPGMQAEVQIVRGTRTLLQYLLDPVTDNMFKAFKEK